MEDHFSVRPDREHGNPLKPSIDLKMSPLFFTCPVRLKRGIRTVRAKNLKKNEHSPIMDDRFSDLPHREFLPPISFGSFDFFSESAVTRHDQ